MSNIDSLLRFDPLAAGEEITGISYKDKNFGEGFDNPATALGFALAHDHSRAKERALKEAGDTTMNNDLARYLTIIEKYGFEEVLNDPWQSSWGHSETFYVFAHRKGLLLRFDTYNGTRVNGGDVYYNWRPSVPWSETWDCRSSGSLSRKDETVWVGHHDCREALIHNLNKLNNRGEFVTPWVERPFLWLLNYDDPKTKGYDHEAITEARAKRLPQWVLEFIGSR